MNEEIKTSGLRVKFPYSPFIYNEKGEVYFCSCGNAEDLVVATLYDKGSMIKTDCHECMGNLRKKTNEIRNLP